jgi:hypothetical protein
MAASAAAPNVQQLNPLHSGPQVVHPSVQELTQLGASSFQVAAPLSPPWPAARVTRLPQPMTLATANNA